MHFIGSNPLLFQSVINIFKWIVLKLLFPAVMSTFPQSFLPKLFITLRLCEALQMLKYPHKIIVLRNEINDWQVLPLWRPGDSQTEDDVKWFYTERKFCPPLLLLHSLSPPPHILLFSDSPLIHLLKTHTTLQNHKSKRNVADFDRLTEKFDKLFIVCLCIVSAFSDVIWYRWSNWWAVSILVNLLFVVCLMFLVLPILTGRCLRCFLQSAPSCHLKALLCILHTCVGYFGST